MKKALLMVLSGALTVSISFSTLAAKLSQDDVEAQVAADSGFSRSKVNNALDAFERQLKEEMASKKAVKLNGFGEYKPREAGAMKHGKTPNGEAVSYQSWRLVKKPEIVSEQEFISKAAAKSGMSDAEYQKVLDSYKKQVSTNLQRGNSMQIYGDGTYKAIRVASANKRNKDGTTTRIPAHMKVGYSSFGKDTHHAFTPDSALSCSMRKC